MTRAVCPQLAVETVFLEASDRLVDGESSGLSERQADALERLAFDWILNAEKYVEPKFAELARARDKVRPASQRLRQGREAHSLPHEL